MTLINYYCIAVCITNDQYLKKIYINNSAIVETKSCYLFLHALGEVTKL